jgi:hypothetical protein
VVYKERCCVELWFFERDVIWRERGGKTAVAAERVRDREMVLNFRFIGLG